MLLIAFLVYKIESLHHRIKSIKFLVAVCSPAASNPELF